MTTIYIDPIIPRLASVVEADIKGAFNKSILDGIKEVQNDTAKFDGDLRAGYQLIPCKVEGEEFTATLNNPTPNSLYRERGRGPGKMPPYREGSNLARWARAKGAVPYLVARKIAREGTERWKNNSNALGVDRTSTTDKIKLQPGGVVQAVRETIIFKVNKLRY